MNEKSAMAKAMKPFQRSDVEPVLEVRLEVRHHVLAGHFADGEDVLHDILVPLDVSLVVPGEWVADGLGETRLD